MKYVIVLGDGMADEPIEALGGLTPLEYAKTPALDAIAPVSEIGLAQTIPEGMSPGSDTANLSVLGYDPKQYYTGRSPLEALSIGIPLKDSDVTLRCNLVTLSDEDDYEDKRMLDYSAGEISTEEAGELIRYLKPCLDDERMTLYAGISYRHCLVVDRGETGNDLTPPHDISDRLIRNYLPKGPAGEKYLELMKRSHALLKDHPVNQKRIAAGKNPANSVWLWGEGTRPKPVGFTDKFGLKGGVISAVDLVKGIGILTGMQIIDVPGCTGNWDTNFRGKALAAADALKSGLDFVYIHMEAPDECGHHGDIEKKIYSIEQISEVVVKTLLQEFSGMGEPFTLLICPDHPTPIALRTHVSDPVPYLLYRSDEEKGNGAASYDEVSAGKTGLFLSRGPELIERMLRR